MPWLRLLFAGALTSVADATGCLAERAEDMDGCMSGRAGEHAANSSPFESGRRLRDLEIARIANLGEKCSKLSLNI